MKSLCVIPARYASSRLPGKPLLDLEGQTLIQRVWRAVETMSLFDRIIVATDDDRIYTHCRDHGMDVVMTSPDHPSGTDRVAEVVRELDGFEVVVNVQGDEPEVSREMLQALLEFMLTGEAAIATPVVISPPAYLSDPNRVKAVLGHNGRALYFSRSGIPFFRSKEEDIPVYCHVGVYAFMQPTLLQVVDLPEGRLEKVEKLEQLRWLEAGYDIHCVQGDWRYGGIDTQEDADRYIEHLRAMKSRES